MDPTYHAVAEFAQTWGSSISSLIFPLVLALCAVAVAQGAVRRGRAHAAAED